MTSIKAKKNSLNGMMGGNTPVWMPLILSAHSAINRVGGCELATMLHAIKKKLIKLKWLE